jgi:phosphatidate phosphatase APP1
MRSFLPDGRTALRCRPMAQLRIVPYRGWTAAGKAVVLARVVEEDTGLTRKLAHASRLVRVTLERFATAGAPAVPVDVTCAGTRVAATTDAGGFVDVKVPVDGTPADARVSVSGASAIAALFGVDPDARFGVISDIDDTVLETELTHPWRRGMQLMFSEQRMRLPFEGIAALYRAFAQPRNPIYYVSNAPWGLYDHVVELLDHHDIVKGPLLLRDRGLERRAGDAHKRTALRRLVEDHPGLRFVLLGDSSRRDPLRYVELAEDHPGRVLAIYIRKVDGLLARPGDLSEVTARAARAGVELVVAGDTLTMAKHAASRGFIP